jgi:exodeoxyribonuclease VII large subunit
MKLRPIKVSALNQFIKKYLMSNAILNNLRVEGEIANIRMSKTGYTYFTLSDESSSINCVAFFSDAISKNGDKVIVEGELTVYEVKGAYQINVKNIERTGSGKILSDLEALKERMKSQGMFEKTKPIPSYPSKIGVVTSITGAAIKDILKTFESVSGNFEVSIYNTLVQGPRASDSIIEGIRYFNLDGSDVILISRGGGSFEDLSVFNDMFLAEEVYKSKVPVVTGIGHETDRTLTDYVADVYCHTPTAAAERIIRGYADVEEKLLSMLNLLRSRARNIITLKTSDLRSSRYLLKSLIPSESIYRQKSELERLRNIISNGCNNHLSSLKFELEIHGERLRSNDYKSQLDKGFAIVSDEDGNILRNFSQFEKDKIIGISMKDFTVGAKITKVEEVEHGKKI